MVIPEDGEIRRAFDQGCNSVLDELFNAIAELEESRSDTSHGRAQRYILRELIRKMCDE